MRKTNDIGFSPPHSCTHPGTCRHTHNQTETYTKGKGGRETEVHIERHREEENKKEGDMEEFEETVRFRETETFS